jgi:hypothetical protein|tara:strand:+ start:8168 stop:8530 length:363 start_codon:yes stop_codon:yes gene_type:complete
MSDVEKNSPTENEEYITVWEAPKIEAPEFRLYYKKDGSVDLYTCEDLEGDYLVIDAGVFAEARPDIKVIDGRITRNRRKAGVQKYKPSTSGVLTSVDDISILVSDKSKGKYWELVNEEIA